MLMIYQIVIYVNHLRPNSVLFFRISTLDFGSTIGHSTYLFAIQFLEIRRKKFLKIFVTSNTLLEHTISLTNICATYQITALLLRAIAIHSNLLSCHSEKSIYNPSQQPDHSFTIVCYLGFSFSYKSNLDWQPLACWGFNQQIEEEALFSFSNLNSIHFFTQ